MSRPTVLVIIAPRDFREEELFGPLELWRGRLDVCVGSTRLGVARGMHGGPYEIASTVGEMCACGFDAVTVIGGTGGPRHLWSDAAVGALLRRTFRRGSLIGGICYGVVALARAGVLAGRRAAVYPDRRAELELGRGGALFTADPLVIDGNTITARGPDDATLFARAILTQLGA